MTTWIFVGAFAAALTMALGFTPLALRFAVRRDIVDRPGSYKKQADAVPYLGGLAIVTSFCIVVLVGGFMRPLATFTFQLPLIVGLGLVLSILGLIDDLKGIGPVLRFTLEATAAAALFAAGIRVELFDVALLDAVITILWIVGITNAFNLLDNMDGLSAGIAVIASFSFFVIAALNGQYLVGALSIALAGCALGFLRHNFHPARIYMGDAGSLFLGFMLAVIGLKLRFSAPSQVTFMVPILVLGIPIFDTILVVSGRLAHRLSPWRGGRDHTSHRLVFVGIPVPAAVMLIYLAAVSMGWLALAVSRMDQVTAYIIAGLVTAIGSFLAVMLSFVPVYETSKRRRMMLVEVKDHEPELEEEEPSNSVVSS